MLSLHGLGRGRGLPFTGGFIDAQTTPHLTENQCENCHGPASEHVKLELEWKKAGGPVGEALEEARKSVRLKKEEAEKKACLKCHDFANSPHFDFETYWPQIEHPTPEARRPGGNATYISITSPSTPRSWP